MTPVERIFDQITHDPQALASAAKTLEAAQLRHSELAASLSELRGRFSTLTADVSPPPVDECTLADTVSADVREVIEESRRAKALTPDPKRKKELLTVAEQLAAIEPQAHEAKQALALAHRAYGVLAGRAVYQEQFRPAALALCAALGQLSRLETEHDDAGCRAILANFRLHNPISDDWVGFDECLKSMVEGAE